MKVNVTVVTVLLNLSCLVPTSGDSKERVFQLGIYHGSEIITGGGIHRFGKLDSSHFLIVLGTHDDFQVHNSE